jgi:hypothetical protein
MVALILWSSMGSQLHPVAKCTSVLANVYQDASRGCVQGSGGMGIRHASDGIDY